MTLNTKYNKLIPLGLSLVLLISDQISKLIIVKTIPLNTVGWRVLGDFFRIIHVRNLGVAFSIGHGLPDIMRRILFILLPLVFVILLLIYYLKDKTISRFQGWAIAGIIGGGLGNLVDRIFRPAGVVDFLDFRFYGLFGMERFPTFNIADSSVVVCGILLIISFLIEERSRKEGEKE